MSRDRLIINVGWCKLDEEPYFWGIDYRNVPACNEGKNDSYNLRYSDCTLSVCRRDDETLSYEINQEVGGKNKVTVLGGHQNLRVEEVTKYRGKVLVGYRTCFESLNGMDVDVKVKRPDTNLTTDMFDYFRINLL